MSKHTTSDGKVNSSPSAEKAILDLIEDQFAMAFHCGEVILGEKMQIRKRMNKASVLLIPFLTGLGEEEATRIVNWLYWEYWHVSGVPGMVKRSYYKAFRRRVAIEPRVREWLCRKCKKRFSKNCTCWQEESAFQFLDGRNQLCPNCNGGKEPLPPHVKKLRAMSYVDYLRSKHWRETSRQRMKLDNWTCQLCLTRGGKLNVHHKTYERRGYEKMSDLITLCETCHERHHIDPVEG